MSILIVGSTGTVGKEVLRALNEKASPSSKISVKLLTRNKDKASEVLKLYENLEGKIVEGDLNDLETVNIDELYENVERMFLLTISSPFQARSEHGFVNLAVKYCKHLQQIVRVSALGNSPERDINCLMRWHNDSERAVQRLVEHSKVKLTILRPNLFLQNFLTQDLQTIKSQGCFYRVKHDLGDGYHISHVDVRDIGDLSAVVLTENPEKHAGQSYNITGPDTFTYDQLAQVLTQAIGKEVKHVPISEDQFAENFKQVPSFVIWMLVKLYQMYKIEGITANICGDFKIVTGKNPRSALQFFVDHADQFK
ncbi:predicted protein [Naegleria gruberi]|uniref:Predicted protein n=1 Tax=Naegleria gruberi TaxID=5762 RepID=D2V7K1_NAEGR|nr:uncharacterized protein NAEGRDRAFT_64831 [Naegleria gruberi]EFC47393.1 predicted protein [Naegleria gruberi]|eukprot:XP_002680137.1 predicted protein [Naegleria gruberi strain NEG-M]